MVSSIFNICSCFLYFTELTWLQNKIENNPLHGCLNWYWCILLGYTRCCYVFFVVSNARGTGTWTNVKFPPTRDLIRVKCPGVARGGMGTLGFDSYINKTIIPLTLVGYEVHVIIADSVLCTSSVILKLVPTRVRGIAVKYRPILSQSSSYLRFKFLNLLWAWSSSITLQSQLALICESALFITEVVKGNSVLTMRSRKEETVNC